MSEKKKVRMVDCTYDGWVRMGRARTRCPRCGAVVQDENPRSAHYVEKRVPEEGE